MVTKFQKKVLDVIGPRGVNDKVAPGLLGVSYNSVQNVKSRVASGFLEDLDVVLEYYPVLESRLVDSPELYTKLRRLARWVNKEASG